MGLIRFAIENPVKISVGVILVILFGILSIFEIPIQLTPDVDKPVITVKTRWAGASPQEIESELVDKQEDKLKNVTNLKKMRSEAKQGEAKITLEFPVGVDKDIAYRDVSDKLRQVTDYPQEVDEPIITSTNNDMSNTIAWIMFYSQDLQDVSHLKTFVEENVKPLLERAHGISEVDVYGGRTREIQIVIDAHKVAARELSLRDIEKALRRQNENISAGTIEQGKRDYTYRTVGEYRSLKDIENTVVAYQTGGPVLIRDIAVVIDGFKKATSFVRSKGRPVLAMPARRETGANVLQTMENLKARIKVVNAEVLEPRGLGLELTQVYDESVYIKSAIWLVVKNIVFGGALAIAVLLIFLRSGSATGIIAVAIPISVIGTFLVITLLGRSLNVVMLAGMAFSVGLVVDNAIVVLENIYRHRAMGKDRTQAALDGAKEVWGAILASTLTTMAVFLPVIFIQEEAGQLFKDIAIAISSSVALSLVVSVVVIPPLASRFFNASSASRTNANKPWRIAAWLASVVGHINSSITKRVMVVAGFSIASIVGSWYLTPASEYLPAGNKNLVFGFLVSPPGYSLEEFRQMATIVEDGDPADPNDGLRPYWDAKLGTAEAAAIEPIDIRIGAKGESVRSVIPPPIDNFFFVSFSGGAFMGCTSQDATNVKPLEQVLTSAVRRIPAVFAMFQQTSLFRSGLSDGNTLDVDLRGEDEKEVVRAASALQRKIMEKGYHHPRATPSNFALGRPEIRIIPHRNKAADLKLDVNDVGFIVESCIDGAFVGEYNDHGDRVDMAIKIAGLDNATVEQIGQVPIYTPTGHIVPLSSAVQLMRTSAAQQINHIEEMNAVSLSVTPKTGVPLQETMREITDEVIKPMREAGEIPPHVITSLAGVADKLTETQHALIGDFRHTVTQPKLLSLSIGTTMLAVVLAAIVLSLAAGLIAGKRVGLNVALMATAIIAVGFLALNPSLALALVKSRVILALLITYLLMAALFESFAYPFVVMFSVPLAMIGGFAALRIVHEVSLFDVTSPIQQLDVLTMLGFVILVGIVVNNAILIVHQALNFMREDNMTPDDAIAHSVRTRTRPILMSAMTSLFGMAPLVIMPGAGSELYRGLGSVVLGGLLVSTIFTLIVVPAMFSLFLQLKTWSTRAFEDAPAEYLAQPSAGSVEVVHRSPK